LSDILNSSNTKEKKQRETEDPGSKNQRRRYSPKGT